MVAPVAERLGISFEPQTRRSPEAPFPPLGKNPFGEFSKGFETLRQRAISAQLGDLSTQSAYIFVRRVGEIITNMDPATDTMDVTLEQMDTTLLEKGTIDELPEGLFLATKVAVEDFNKETNPLTLPWEKLSSLDQVWRKKTRAPLHDTIIVARAMCEYAQLTQQVAV